MENSQPQTQLDPPQSSKGRKVVTVLLVLAFIFGVSLMGCSAVMNKVTPLPVSSVMGDFMEEDIPQLWGFTTLDVAQDILMRARIKHRNAMILLKRDLHDNDLGYADLKTYLIPAIEASKEFQDVVVGSAGNPLSIAGLLAMGAPALLAGMSIKRKQDYTPEQVKKLAKDVAKRTEEKVKGELANATA